MTQDKIIAAAREAGFANQFPTGPMLDMFERFYALAYRQGMERAAEIADDLPAPASCSGSERSLWDVASTEIADAIRAHAQNQTEGK